MLIMCSDSIKLKIHNEIGDKITVLNNLSKFESKII